MSTTTGPAPHAGSCQPVHERGSALIVAIFVLALLTAMGASLLLVTETEMKSSKVDLDAKQVFSAAEAGLEDGRETLRIVNASSPSAANRESLDDELIAATGGDGTMNFDAANIKGTYDSSGNPTGFTGYGDDVPIRALATFGQSKYIAFIQNDPVDGLTTTHDTNDRAMITAAAAGPRRTFETVQAIVERISFPDVPATITILGPNASFDGGNSTPKQYTGNDCDGTAVPNVPVLGVIGATSVTSAAAGVHKPDSYTSGADSGTATVVNVNATIDANWKDCQYLLDLARAIRAAADVVGDASTPNSSLGTVASPRIVYIEGDYSVNGSFSGAGLLWVTGTLTFSGNASWSGLIFCVGDGSFVRSGGGNGVIQGANFVASVSGADGVMWTADDCKGADGIAGTADDGIAHSSYDNSGGGTGVTGYCLRAIHSVQEQFPYKIVDFRQR